MFGEQLLQASVLVLKLLPPPRVTDFHARILPFLAIEHLLAYLMLMAYRKSPISC